MQDDNIKADGYYDEDVSSPKEDFDLSFLGDDESDKK